MFVKRFVEPHSQPHCHFVIIDTGAVEMGWGQGDNPLKKMREHALYLSNIFLELPQLQPFLQTCLKKMYGPTHAIFKDFFKSSHLGILDDNKRS